MQRCNGLFCSLYSNRAGHFFLTPKLTVTAAQKGRAFVRAQRKDLDWIFSVQHERTVNNDITLENRVFQLDKTRWRNTLAGQTVMVHEHPDGRMSEGVQRFV